MRYENENPQVTFFREEAEKWEDLAKKALATAKGWEATSAKQMKLLKEWERIHSDTSRWKREWEDKARKYEKKMEEFNKLPWWKKMFFNFKSE